jgi:hypothetical protein
VPRCRTRYLWRCPPRATARGPAGRANVRCLKNGGRGQLHNGRETKAAPAPPVIASATRAKAADDGASVSGSLFLLFVGPAHVYLRQDNSDILRRINPFAVACPWPTESQDRSTKGRPTGDQLASRCFTIKYWRAGQRNHGSHSNSLAGPAHVYHAGTSTAPVSTNSVAQRSTSGSSAISSQHDSTKAIAAARLNGTRRCWRADS